jgi:N-acetylmuramoyl-L-alanine amidase
LHKAYMPRILIETGFISNQSEGNALDSDEGQNEIAKAIAEAIISYKNEYFGNGNSDNYVEKQSQKIIEKVVKDTSSPVKSKLIVAIPKEKKVVLNANTNEIVFKVQLSASTKKTELISSNFKGLDNVEMVSEGKLYKYLYGVTSDYDEAKKLLVQAKSKGYKTAYLIAYKNGDKISVKEALQ